MIDLTNIVNAVLALAAALITAFVIPWIKAKASLQQQEALAGVYRTLIFAAEQIYGSGHGEEKLNYVKAQLMDRGYTIDTDMIEATVMTYFGHKFLPEDTTKEEEESEEDEEPQKLLM